MTAPPWRRRGSRHLFRSGWFNLRQDQVTLPSGQDITYTLVEHPGYAMVLPILDDGRVVMERIYRYTVERTLLECPSGGLDGDAPAIAARRELEEETGYRAAELAPLGSYYGSKGISDERFHLFVATGLTADGTERREPTEADITIELVPFPALVEMALSGAIEDAPSVLAILLARERGWGRRDESPPASGP